MKKNKNIFNKKLLGALSVLALFATNNALAADNGCDNPKNDRINPEIALCSTHVYNIGFTNNQPSEANKQLMRDVVALKSTVMTQQMYKQYEYLDATLKRFKTQLEKAVLTTKLMAAGADTSSAGGSSYSGVSTGSGSSYRSNDSNIKLAGAQNCMQVSYENAHSCLTSNMQLIMNAVNGGNSIGEARKQLEVDLDAAAMWQIIQGQKGEYTNKTGTLITECNALRNDRKVVLPCAQKLNSLISMDASELKRQQNMYNRNNYMP